MSLNGNTGLLSEIIEMVNALPEAGAGGGAAKATITVTVDGITRVSNEYEAGSCPVIEIGATRCLSNLIIFTDQQTQNRLEAAHRTLYCCYRKVGEETFEPFTASGRFDAVTLIVPAGGATIALISD